MKSQTPKAIEQRERRKDRKDRGLKKVVGFVPPELKPRLHKFIKRIGGEIGS